MSFSGLSGAETPPGDGAQHTAATKPPTSVRKKRGGYAAERILAGERSAASSSASFALAARRLRSLTWPKPRISSGIAAICTASAWLSLLRFSSSCPIVAS